MKYGIKNEKILTSEEVLAILHRSAVRYSEYADTTLLFLFREKKTEGYNFYEVSLWVIMLHRSYIREYNVILQKKIKIYTQGENNYEILFWSRCWIYETANVIKLEKKI